MATPKTFGFFVLQLFVAFLVLSTITYFLPRDFWLHALVGFSAFLFINVFFDFILKLFGFDTSEQSNGYSKLRNRLISKNYFWIAALLFLSGLGSLIYQKSVNDIILLGVPLLVVWGVLLFWGTPTRILHS